MTKYSSSFDGYCRIDSRFIGHYHYLSILHTTSTRKSTTRKSIKQYFNFPSKSKNIIRIPVLCLFIIVSHLSLYLNSFYFTPAFYRFFMQRNKIFTFTSQTKKNKSKKWFLTKAKLQVKWFLTNAKKVIYNA